MAIGRIVAVMAVSATVAPAAFLPPPLYSGPSTQKSYDFELTQISQTGLGGFVIYRQSCLSCHGEQAKGTLYGPALNLQGGPKDNASRKKFHQSVTGDIAAHGKVFEDKPPVSWMQFNDIELIARYIRELSMNGKLK